MAMTFRAWVLGLAVAATTTVGAAKESVSIRVSPATSFAPANLVIRTRIEPDAANRAMEIIADSGDFYRASTIPVDGDRAPKTSMFQYLGLPPGEYEVTATLLGPDGQSRALARTHANVIESGVSR
jgi:hypothetical protein